MAGIVKRKSEIGILIIILLCKSENREHYDLMCPYDQIVDFLHFRIQDDFLTHLAKFQSITNIRSLFFWTFISKNLRPPLLDLVPRLGCKLEKMTSDAQKYLTG